MSEAADSTVASYVFYGSAALIVFVPFLFRTTANFLVNCIGFLYPTWASTVAILKKDDNLSRKWLVYWVVYVILYAFQLCFHFILCKIPFFPIFNAALLLALMHFPYNGHDSLAQYIYFTHLAPLFGKAALKADDVLKEAIQDIKDDPKGFADNLMSNSNKDDTPRSSHDDDDTPSTSLLEKLQRVESEVQAEVEEAMKDPQVQAHHLRETLSGTLHHDPALSAQAAQLQALAREMGENFEAQLEETIQEIVNDTNQNEAMRRSPASPASPTTERNDQMWQEEREQKISNSTEILKLEMSEDEVDLDDFDFDKKRN